MKRGYVSVSESIHQNPTLNLTFSNNKLKSSLKYNLHTYISINHIYMSCSCFISHEIFDATHNNANPVFTQMKY